MRNGKQLRSNYPFVFLGVILLYGIVVGYSGYVSTISGQQNLQALSAMENGRTDQALRFIDRAIRLDSSNPALWANKAFFLLSTDPAVADFDRFINGEPLVDSQSDRYPIALELLCKASELSPRDPIFLLDIGWLYIAMDSMAIGEGYLNRALSLSPYDPVLLVSGGLVAERNHRTERAGELYKRAFCAAPELLYSSFFADLSRRLPETSRQLIIELRDSLATVLRAKIDYKLQAKLAHLELWLGDTLTARSMLQEVVSHYPGLNRAWLAIGQAGENGAEDKTLSDLRKAQLLDRSDPLPAYYLGMHYKQSGQSDQAAKYYKQAVLCHRYAYSDYNIRAHRIYHARMWENEIYPCTLLPRLAPQLPSEKTVDFVMSRTITE